MRRAPLFRAALALAALPACEMLLGGIDDERGAARPVAEADAAAPDPCVLQGLTPPPAGTGLGERGRLYFAMHVSQFVPEGRRLGIDLDGRCTGLAGSARAGSSCVASGDASLDDEDAGVDNSFAKIFREAVYLQSASPSGDPIAESFNADIRMGRRTGVIALFGYNGEDDDDDVRVAIVDSPGIETTGCAEPSDASTAPRWDGCDRWTYPAGLLVVDGDVVQTTQGYVNQRRLVVSAKDGVDFSAGEIRLPLRDAYLSARIDRVDGGLALTDALISGRLVAAQAAEGIGRFLSDGLPLCANQALFGEVKRLLCGARDLSASAALDNTGAPCDAISMAVSFDALPIRLGGPRTPAASPDCADAGTSCE